MFWLDESLQASIYLDGIVTVVDLLNVERSLDTHDHGGELSTAHLQISLADVVLLNKSDLVDEGTKAAATNRIQSINALAKVYLTEYSHISLSQILDLQAYRATASSIEFQHPATHHLDHVPCPGALLTVVDYDDISPATKFISRPTRCTRRVAPCPPLGRHTTQRVLHKTHSCP
jgi:G3E family GTPase